MKKIVLYLFVMALIASCKKENAATQQIDITGSWSLGSAVFQNGVTVTATQYPCLSNNVLTIDANGTAITKYTSVDGCSIPTASGTITVGMPGDSSVSSWSRNANNIHLKQTTLNGIVNSYGTVVNAGSILQLTLTDTIPVSRGTPIINTSVYIK